MKLITVAICWNEEHLLPYYLRHYEQYADKMIIFDNYSDDNSAEIISAHPKAELRFFNTNGESREDMEVDIKNFAPDIGREEDADWVIVGDMDEFVWHENLVGHLMALNAAGITVPYASYYHMITPEFPTTTKQIYDQVINGVRAQSKHMLFACSGIARMNYGPGGHHCRPGGSNVTFGPYKFDWHGDNTLCGSPHGLKILHARFLGANWTVNRFKDLAQRKSTNDKLNGFGEQYFIDRQELYHIFEQFEEAAQPVFGDGPDGFYFHKSFV